MATHGINFDTDRDVWRSEFVRREIETIGRDFHCDAVLLLGHDLDRLTESAAIAADHGLGVWFEPRQFDADATATLDFLAATATVAETLRVAHPDVVLSVGVLRQECHGARFRLRQPRGADVGLASVSRQRPSDGVCRDTEIERSFCVTRCDRFGLSA